jgi:Uncharacterised nucleotidyltransferase
MLRNKIDSIVRSLSVRSDAPELPKSFAQGTARDWRRVLGWLDASGLALYFLRRLEEASSTHGLPEDVLTALRQRQSNNSARTRRMRRTFEILNRRFSEAGVLYAALKGFSLIPEYSPDASLRMQSDLDYLIARSSLDDACRILAEQGYVLKTQTGEEFAFGIPGQQATQSVLQYDPESPYTIELQCALWDHGLRDYPVLTRQIAWHQIQVHSSEGLLFRALPEQEAFIGQVLHVFGHMLNDVVKPCCLLEISYFLKYRPDEAWFSSFMASLSNSNPTLAEVIGLVSRLAAQLFDAPVRNWIRPLDPMLQFWLDRYGREFVLESCLGQRTRLFPPTKLVLFLKQRYVGKAHSGLSLFRRALLPAEGLQHLRDRPARPASRFQLVTKKSRWLASRSLYHLRSNIRYLWETPGWYLNKKRNAAHACELVSKPGGAA